MKKISTCVENERQSVFHFLQENEGKKGKDPKGEEKPDPDVVSTPCLLTWFPTCIVVLFVTSTLK